MGRTSGWKHRISRQGHVILEAPNAPPIQGGKEFTLGIRPEHIVVNQQNEGKGVIEIEVVESSGRHYLLARSDPGRESHYS